MFFQIILYIFIIILLHYLWNVLKDTFTVKKKKNSQIEINKYRQILEEQHSKKEETLEIDLEQDLQIFLQNNI